MITFRSLAWFGLITFVPLYEVSLGHSESYGNYVFAGMLLVGAIGTLAAGPLADRLGLRTVLPRQLRDQHPVDPRLPARRRDSRRDRPGRRRRRDRRHLRGDDGDGAAVSAAGTSALASGLSIGFAIGLGGVAAVVLGAIADSIDLRTSLFVSAAAPLVALALTALLPPTGARRRLEPEVAVP